MRFTNKQQIKDLFKGNKPFFCTVCWSDRGEVEENVTKLDKKLDKIIGELDTPDSGGDSGRAVKSYYKTKQKTLKALMIWWDVLPKELTRIDKCKFQQENLELITVTALSLWGGGGGPQTLATMF